MTSIRYLDNQHIQQLFTQAQEFRKSATTGLRLPKSEEIGQEFPTYVKDGDTVRQESLNIIKEDTIIARNPYVIGQQNGQDIYNEWGVQTATIVKNYGQDVVDQLTQEFEFYKKKAVVKAIPLTQEIFELFAVQEQEFPIHVDWSPEPMLAKVGDYLTSGGYSISAHDMTGYELIE